MSTVNSQQRVLSGMRPTGRLHLGHYHGVLQNWIKLKYKYECFFFVADWHALTTHYGDATLFEDNVIEMVIDWLAVGVNPGSAARFVQSKVPEHAELHLLCSRADGRRRVVVAGHGRGKLRRLGEAEGEAEGPKRP